jgi:hypothetical protein
MGQAEAEAGSLSVARRGTPDRPAKFTVTCREAYLIAPIWCILNLRSGALVLIIMPPIGSPCRNLIRLASEAESRNVSIL